MGSWVARAPSSHSYLPGCPRWGLFNKLPIGSWRWWRPLAGSVGWRIQRTLGTQLSTHHPIPLARGTVMTPYPHSWQRPTPQPSCGLPSSLWLLTVGSPDDLSFFTIQDFLCPQETLDCHCANHSVIGNGSCYGPGRGGGFSPSSLSLGCSAISSLPTGACFCQPPSAVPVVYGLGILPSLTCSLPTPGLPALPLPPQRPLQELEGMGFSSLSCLAVGTARHSVPWAFLKCHSRSSPNSSGPQCLWWGLSDRPGRVRRV